MLSSEDFTFYDIRDQRRNAFAKYEKKGWNTSLIHRERGEKKQNLWLPNQNLIDMPEKLNAFFEFNLRNGMFLS